MPITQPYFANDNYYHVYNRGVAKQVIFHEDRDFHRFLDTIAFYLETQPKAKFSTSNWDYVKVVRTIPPEKPLVEIISFCLMPNHFHLLMKQVEEGGVSNFLRRSLNSYTHYYNTKRTRVGPLFQGTFRTTLIKNNEQLLHVSRYIHLNPFVSKLVGDSTMYPWSSYPLYLTSTKNRLCAPDIILGLAGSEESYKQFVEDYAEYARSLADLKDLLIDLAD